MTSSVIVKNISKTVKKETIHEIFSSIGRVINTEWNALDNENTCKLTFDSPSCVTSAVLLSGTPLGDRLLSIAPLEDSAEPLSPKKEPHLPPRMLTPAETIAKLNAAARKLNLETAEDEKNLEEEKETISKTVYVGNVAPQFGEAEVRNFFAECGDVIFVKMAGNPALGIKYAFVEFVSREAAQRAMALTGTGAMMGDRPVKVGPAMTAITKPPSMAVNSDPARIESAMSKVKRLTKEIEERKMRERRRREEKRFRKRSASRSRRRSRSPRRHRSRSRNHPRSRRRHRSRSRSREPRGYRGGRLPPRRVPQAVLQAQEGMVWDGFQWTPPSGLSVRQKSENLATKIMDAASADTSRVNPSAQQAMVQQAHQQAALLRAHMEKLQK